MKLLAKATLVAALVMPIGAGAEGLYRYSCRSKRSRNSSTR